MEELFGVSMNIIMAVLLAIVLPAMVVVAVMAWHNRIMLKMGLRNIPRRRAQTVLIIIGIMLSSVIMAAAFGTGDTISFSIRNEATKILKTIDEIIVSTKADAEDNFAASSYIPYERFEQMERDLAGMETIDGLSGGIGETVPVVNSRTSLSEGRARVAGVDPDSLQGFGTIDLLSGGEARLEDLAEDEIYVNEEAVKELEAVVGDNLLLYVEGETLTFRVKGVVGKGGLAGDGTTLIMPLERAQTIFDRPGQINSIVVSNRGDEVAGAELSDEVTRDLRVLFADKEVASRLKGLLNQEVVLRALEERETSLDATLQGQLAQLRVELEREEVSDQLINLLADEAVSDEVLNALEGASLIEVQRDADTLFSELGEFSVVDLKRQILDVAEQVSSFVTTFFITMGLFSIMVGILLIFLIFIMLAAARRSEMGMARAVGAKRIHLIQMFVFEGTAYAVVASAVGVVIGLAVSALITSLVNQIFSGFDDDFQFAWHVEARSVIVAYCLGMVITFITISVSSYRVSRMNIVQAVRGLPETTAVSIAGWREIMLAPLRAMALPFRLAGRSAHDLVTIHPLRALTHLRQTVWAILSIPTAIIGSIFQIVWRPFKQGWLAFLLGVLITWSGTASEEAAPFRIGVALMILGLGLMIRTVLEHTSMRVDVRDRIAFTFIGVVMLAFWVLPFDIVSKMAGGDLGGGIEMFFISGVAMVAAAVWTLMYNSDLLLKGLNIVAGRFGKMRPVMVTAVAYPMSAKFRTGLTLAMFALVIFTLIVMSILTNVFDVSSVDQEEVTGGWDIEGTLNFSTPIEDMRQVIDEEPDLHIQDFEAIGGYTTIPIQARQIGAQGQLWERYAVRAADDDFLEATNYKFKLIADGYGPTGKEVWDALRADLSLAVVDAMVAPRRTGFNDNNVPFEMEGFFYEDDTMPAIDIEVREPRTGEIVPLKVIGVLSQLTDDSGTIGLGMFTSKANLDNAIPFPVPITTYRFRVAEGVDMEQVSKRLEASFQEYGMETVVLEQQIRENASANKAFNYIFTGFMGLGLLVGIAALGVISLRAVVERRQQIGVLRAIGYRRRMIQLSFLLESSFIALLGVAIGVALGTIISYNIVNQVRTVENIETLRFSIPWLQIIVIIVIAYVFSLVTTFLPARQASRIYPAEALRYE